MLSSCALASASDFECNYEGSVPEQNACALRDFQVAEQELTDAYAQAKLRSRTVEAQDALREQQRAWIKRREAICLPKRKGSHGAVEYFTCLQSMAEVRTLQLLR